MLIDPYGDILCEVRSFDSAFEIATLTRDKLKLAGGHRYINARKPELYKEILSTNHKSEVKPVWMK